MGQKYIAAVLIGITIAIVMNSLSAPQPTGPVMGPYIIHKQIDSNHLIIEYKGKLYYANWSSNAGTRQLMLGMEYKP